MPETKAARSAFGKAFAEARDKGLKEFSFKTKDGKTKKFHTRTADEESSYKKGMGDKDYKKDYKGSGVPKRKPAKGVTKPGRRKPMKKDSYGPSGPRSNTTKGAVKAKSKNTSSASSKPRASMASKPKVGESKSFKDYKGVSARMNMTKGAKSGKVYKSKRRSRKSGDM